MKTNTYISLFVGMMVNAVLFGTGAIAVLSVPALGEYWKILIPIVVVLSFMLAWPISRWIAPRLRIRNHPDRLAERHAAETEARLPTR